MTSYLITVATFVSISAILGLALNFQWGTGGLVNFGLPGFFALAAYTTAISSLQGHGAIVALCSSMLVCAGASGIVALITMRLNDQYMAIVTLGFGELIRLIALNESWLTGGALGMPGVPRLGQGLVQSEHYDLFFVAICIAALGSVAGLLELLLRSPFGRLMRAIREDDIVSSSLGKNVLKSRVLSFSVGGAVIGVAGTLHAFHLGYIDPSQFTPIVMAYAFMAVIAGGRGSNLGLLVGASTIMMLLEGTRFLKDIFGALDGNQVASARMILIGIGLILILIFRPQGLVAEYRLKVREGKQDKPVLPLQPERLP